MYDTFSTTASISEQLRWLKYRWVSEVFHTHIHIHTRIHTHAMILFHNKARKNVTSWDMIAASYFEMLKQYMALISTWLLVLNQKSLCVWIFVGYISLHTIQVLYGSIVFSENMGEICKLPEHLLKGLRMVARAIWRSEERDVVPWSEVAKVQP